MPRKPLRILAVAGALFGLLVLAGWWYWQGFELQPPQPGNPQATAADLTFLAHPPPPRGRILAVVSSTPRLADGRKGGYELTELSRAYWTFLANGFEVDIASPRGDEPPMVLDEGLVDADYAFLNDADVQRRLRDTLALRDVDPTRYAAVYFVGGKGAMVDFPDNPDVVRIIRDIDARGGVLAGICHGPAALAGATRADGTPFLRGRRATAFTNDEELFLIEDAQALFGTLLQDRIIADGAEFDEGPMYLDNVVVDGRIVTGQNPWSTWTAAEAVVRALGHTPVARQVSGEELAVAVIARYWSDGYDAARAMLDGAPHADASLILMHGVVAAMRGELAHAFQLQRLARR